MMGELIDRNSVRFQHETSNVSLKTMEARKKDKVGLLSFASLQDLKGKCA